MGLKGRYMLAIYVFSFRNQIEEKKTKIKLIKFILCIPLTHIFSDNIFYAYIKNYSKVE
jgi:hypothetical protein